MPAKCAFAPDCAVPPGAALKEVLETKSVSHADLAMRTGLTEKTVSPVHIATAPISGGTAAKRELALGVPARSWNSRESERRGAPIRLAEAERPEAEAAWLDQIPVKELVERRLVQPAATKAGQVREVLKLFQASGIAARE